MKKTRILALILAAAVCLCLSACGGKKEGAAKTPEELADAYAQAITAARDTELNDAFGVTTNTTQDPPPYLDMSFATLGFTAEDTKAYALSMSLMNVNAYAIVAAMPAEGKEETVKTGLENYVEAQKSSFEFYLEDQFDIAANAKLETLDDGTLLLVMCQGQDEVFEGIKTNLAG